MHVYSDILYDLCYFNPDRLTRISGYATINKSYKHKGYDQFIRLNTWEYYIQCLDLSLLIEGFILVLIKIRNQEACL